MARMKKKEDEERILNDVAKREERVRTFAQLVSFAQILIVASAFLSRKDIKYVFSFGPLFFLIPGIINILRVKGYRILGVSYFLSSLILLYTAMNVVVPASTIYYILTFANYIFLYKATKQKVFNNLWKLVLLFALADIIFIGLKLLHLVLLLLLLHQMIHLYALLNMRYVDILYTKPDKIKKKYSNAKGLDIPVDFETRTPKQIFRTLGGIYFSPVITSDEFVCFTSADGSLYSFASNGELKWKVDAGSEDFSGPLLDSEENIFIVSSSGMLIKLSAKGEEIFRIRIKRGISCMPVIFNDMIYLFNTAGVLYEISTDGERQRTVFNLNEFIDLSPIITEDSIYVLLPPGELYRFSMDGEKIWKTDMGTVTTAPVISEDGIIYVGSNDKSLYAVNSEDGSVIWKFGTDSELTVTPALDKDGRIYFGSGKRFYCLDKDKNVLWEFSTKSEISSPPTITDDYIYFGCKNGDFYSLRTDGTVDWYYKFLTGVYAKPAVSKTGTVYVPCSDGSVYAF
ncbi:PQQ-binding-like beta-propeller repeat protein [Fervidobacterium islandicum]|uniref:PQQ-binding-like beta-propeller repeat protein n=1 Tax=Fervidobacterium islandicum TaxID=2423 RepID=A0AAI8CMH9_FERIS|nr:PQQ-binding-like beta-propeller repeat protein [Fervidobacterium islandicum]AMW33279.1 PQQ-binding-like beta-propeller repeat protein [Fervidobacterium islandicum]